MFERSARFGCLALTLSVLIPAPVFAYVGPGAGLTALGTMVAVIAVVLLAVVGFVWYPLKRLMRRRRAENAVPGSDPSVDKRRGPD